AGGTKRRFGTSSRRKRLLGTRGMPKPARSISPRMAHSRIFWECSSPGHQAFLDRHEEIFEGRFRGPALRQDVVSLRFVGPEAAVVETLTWVSGLSACGSATRRVLRC